MQPISTGLKERVLLVDDEPQVLVALEDVLGDDFTVLAVDSAERALTVMDEDRNIAVLITDQRMPGMTGDELLARLDKSCETTRILVTAFADLSAVIRAVNEGAIFAYVTKPWDPDDLRLKVHKAAERFRLAQDLAHERQLLRDLMDNTPDGIYFKDRDLRFLRVNRSFAAMVEEGGAPEGLVGACLGEVLPAVDVDAGDAEERRILTAGAPVLDVVREYRQGEGKRWLSETKAPIRGPSGDIVGLVGISRDVTQQRRLEEQLRQAQKMDAVGQLAGGIAHDFNNILAVIGSYCELLLDEIPVGDPKRGDVDEMLSAVRRATSLTKQLLAFSRKQIVQPTVLDLNQVVPSVEKMLCRVIGEDIALRTVLAPSLGRVRADAGQIEQILLNLVVNARDAMPGGGKLTIETANVELDASYAGGRAGPFVMLAVTDTGTGMDAETRKRIFEPFFTTKEVGKGTGLGLSTVYGIVQQSEGHIWVYSEVGGGTAFKIYLPRLDAMVDVAQEADSSPRSSRAVATILLVDDDEAVGQVAARILRGQGHNVLLARRAAEARRICAERGASIDLLLTDVVMPEINGPMLAKELSLLCPRMRVLYMSGYSGAAILRQGSLEPGTGYLEKPFAATTLAERVGELLVVSG